MVVPSCGCAKMWLCQVGCGCGFAGQEEEAGPAEQPEGPFEVSLQYNGPAVLLWLWSNAHSSENTGLKAQPIKHTAGNSGARTINHLNQSIS